MNLSRFSCRCAATFALLSGVCVVQVPLWAQETLSPIPSPQSQTRTFRLRNVRPSLVAYWLDPNSHPVPRELRSYSTLDGSDTFTPERLLRLPGNGRGPLDVKLPTGITKLIVADPQNGLMAVGTPEALEALEKLVTTLDVPLVQYEVEAQFFEISRADLPKMGINFGEQTQQSPDFFGAVALVPADFQAKAKQLIEQRRTKVVTAPRVTAIDGLSAQLQMNTSTPFVMTEAAVPQNVGEPPLAMRQLVAYVTNTIGIRATPFQRKDDLVSLAIVPVLGTRTLTVATTVRDGQSFAIQMSPPKDKRQIVVVVTSRRVRRAGDDTAIAKTDVPVGRIVR